MSLWLNDDELYELTGFRQRRPEIAQQFAAALFVHRGTLLNWTRIRQLFGLVALTLLLASATFAAEFYGWVAL